MLLKSQAVGGLQRCSARQVQALPRIARPCAPPPRALAQPMPFYHPEDFEDERESYSKREQQHTDVLDHEHEHEHDDPYFHNGPCFALETMSEDGQSWVMDELGHRVVGLAHRTPRAQVRTTHLLDYRGDLFEGDKAMRCGQLNLALGWEATCKGHEDKKYTGQAKVTLHNKDKTDVVSVEVALDPSCDCAGEPGNEKAVRDVVYAVESLDAVLMEQLNDFLWTMERRNSRSNSSMSGPE